MTGASEQPIILTHSVQLLSQIRDTFLQHFLFYISVCSCIEAVGDGVTVLTNSSVENLKKTDRCLRVLENVGNRSG